MKAMIWCLLIAFLFVLTAHQPVVDSTKKLKRLLDYFPHKPALIIYEINTQMIQQHSKVYNRLFQATKDYSLALVIDCQENLNQEKDSIFEACSAVIKENSSSIVHIEAYKPNENLISVRGKMFRIAPRYSRHELSRDYNDLYDLIEELTPNYIRKLYSEDDIKDYLNYGNFLLPRVFIYTDAEEYPSIRKLAVYFYERAEFAQVLTMQYNETKLIVYEFDFVDKDWKKHVFPAKITMKQYENMKQFIQNYASKTPIRRQYEYLTIPPAKIQVATPDNYTKALYQNIERYMLVYSGSDTQNAEQVLQAYLDKYGQFLNYLINVTEGEPKLVVAHNQSTHLSLDKPELYRFKAYSFQQIESNAQQLVIHGNIIFLVEPALDYFCSIQNLQALNGFLNCYPILQEDVALTKEKFGIPQQDKLAILFSSSRDGHFEGKNINNLTFQNVLGMAYSVVYNRVKALAKNFTDNPLFPISDDQPYSKLCKSCFLYLHYSEPNYVKLNNYKQSAFEHNRQLLFFEGNVKCNRELFRFIGIDPKQILVFISNSSVFHVGEVSPQMINKIVRKWKQKTLRMRILEDYVKSNEDCEEGVQNKHQEGDEL